MSSIKEFTYRPDVDGLRAISIILVLLFHGLGELLPGGYVGVDVFFVISGYLITGQIYSKLDEDSFSFIDFYSRRVKRIVPPLIIVMSMCLLFAWFNLSLSNFESLGKHIASGAGFVSNILLWKESGYFDSQSEFKPLLHLWSLGVEEQFYIVWPALIFLAYRLSKRGVGISLLIVLLVCVTSLAMSLVWIQKSQVISFYSPLTRLWELGIGGALLLAESSQLWRYFHRLSDVPKSRLQNIASVTGLLLLSIAAMNLSKDDLFPGVLALIPVVAACLIISAGPSAMVNQYLLANRVVIFIGLISYSVYLWHWPLLSFAYIKLNAEPSLTWRIALIATSILLGYLTWATVESRIRHLKHRLTSIWLLAALFVLGLIGYWGFTNKVVPERLDAQLQIKQARIFDSSGIPVKDCSSILDTKSVASKYCSIWGKDTAKETIVVWGDSLAAAWMPVFLTQQKQADLRVIQISHAACPPMLDVHRTGKSFASEWCNDGLLQRLAFNAIAKAAPSKIFLISRWNLYFHGHIKNDQFVESSFITAASGPATEASAKEAFETKLPYTIKELEKIAPVIVFKGTPVLKVPLDVGMLSMPTTFEPRTAEFHRFESSLDEIIDRVAARSKKVKVFDASYLLCNSEKCPAFIQGIPVYSDEVHITAAAALLFKSDIGKLVFEP